MLEQLLKEGKISREEVWVYELFALNEIGRKLIKGCKDKLYETKVINVDSVGTYANLEGRRDIFRGIDYTIKTIENLLKGDNNE